VSFLQGFGLSLLEGLGLTLKLSFFSLVLGLCFGCFGAMAKLSTNPFFQFLARIYTLLMKSVPELLVLLMIYYGGASLLSYLFHQPVQVDAFIAGVLALSTILGAYATETIRAAFMAVPAGQLEAARAFGFSRFQIFRRIHLPLAWRYALPGIGNLWLVLLKDSSLVSILGLEDVMRKARIASGFTGKPFTFYLAAAVLYFGVTIFSTWALRLMQNRTELGVRRVRL
jgi:His/Glu/Gln/Arg/opine family amino acid ABC transporter permease subunit